MRFCYTFCAEEPGTHVSELGPDFGGMHTDIYIFRILIYYLIIIPYVANGIPMLISSGTDRLNWVRLQCPIANIDHVNCLIENNITT
jgi:hypothetical protein